MNQTIERETTTIEIGKNKFKVKSYATAREAATIQNTYFRGTKVEMVNQAPKISDFNPGIHYEVKLETIKLMVMAINDTITDPAAITEYCEQLPSDQFDDLTIALDAIVVKKKN